MDSACIIYNSEELKCNDVLWNIALKQEKTLVLNHDFHGLFLFVKINEPVPVSAASQVHQELVLKGVEVQNPFEFLHLNKFQIISPRLS